jgi:lipoyl(octanoyl) transferase
MTPLPRPSSLHDAALQAYLLGSVEFDDALRLQRRLHYDISGDHSQAALVLCEHPPLISVGRQGSRAHLFWEQEELDLRGWPIRWVNRGGGCWLHLPGQLAFYAIVPLDRFGLDIPQFLHRTGAVLGRVLDDFGIKQGVHILESGVAVGNRPVAALGIAVRDGVTYYGGCLNVHPDLEPYRSFRCHPSAREPMTSLERERRGPVRAALVRERLLDHFQAEFGFQRVSLFSEHPVLGRAVRRLETHTQPHVT